MEKLKQKVASSSSRVIASLQQAATGTFQISQQQQHQQHQANPIAGGNSQAQESSARPSSPGAVMQPEMAGGFNETPARLMAAQATAHLTEEEREILLQVFKKEEQFQRDTINQMSGLRSALPQAAACQLQHQDAATTRLPPSNKENRKQLSHSAPRSIRQTVTSHSMSSSLHSNSTSGAENNGCGAISPFASARSATPLSQTPTSQRAQSSCSGAVASDGGLRRATGAASTLAAGGGPMGQCRICRKSIFANETCHLCSACNQFVCEDCGSYSATDKHWMCSSCRRRATKPAIPAEALKELGLNQNSTAVRRMTLRLNQAELMLAQASKGSSESSASSSSSSGCSSQSAKVARAAASGSRQMGSDGLGQLRLAAEELESRQQQTRGHKVRPEMEAHGPKMEGSREASTTGLNQAQTGARPSATSRDSAAKTTFAVGRNNNNDYQQRNQGKLANQGPKNTAEARLADQAAHCDSRAESGMGQRRGSAEMLQQRMQQRPQRAARGDPRVGAHKTLSNPAGGVDVEQQLLAGGEHANKADPRNRTPARTTMAGEEQVQPQQQQHPYQQQLERPPNAQRRASLAASAWTGSGPTAAGGTTSSSMQPTLGSQGDSSNFFHQVGRRHQRDSIGAYGHEDGNSSSMTLGAQFVQPQTMVTASSDVSLDGGQFFGEQVRNGRHGSMAAIDPIQQHQDTSYSFASTLVPLPSEHQMQVRRLSDQSNLIRRSSVISETLDCFAGTARNRSYSNIGAIDTLAQFGGHQPDFGQQQQQTGFIQQTPILSHHNQPARSAARGMSTEESPFGAYERQQDQKSLNVAGYEDQQRRPSDQWVMQQHVAAQQEALAYTAKEYHQATNVYMSSIITPCSQKKRQASEEMNSDSSSDIEDDLMRDTQRAGGFEFDSNEQPNGYFAPPTMGAAGIHQIHDTNYNMDYYQQQYHDQQYSNPISIPSVSISEFNSSQQRLNQICQQQQPSYDQIMTTPMQINLAIEQAIQQQQQNQRRSSHDFLAAGLDNHLTPRRGSSGRLLPKVPGEQSRSLLDLPCNNQQNGGPEGANGDAASGGLAGQQHLSTLHLPIQTVRRASAPEGQNIKIVVDDMDGSIMQGAGPLSRKQSRTISGAKGELYERLVLYRDDTLDPTTSMAHGFGLQVMGGKMDEENKLQAFVSWVLPGGPADKVGLKQGDKIIEWDGKCLVNMSYEQVADVIESSANIAELLVKPVQRLDTQFGTNLIRSQRRMSQQTERDLRRISQQTSDRNFDRRSSIVAATCSSVDPIYSSTTSMANCHNESRTGRRRLPQIPGLNLISDQGQVSGERGSITGCGGLAGDNGFLCAINYNQQQHSASTGELFPAQSSAGQQNSLGASSFGVLNLNQAQNDTWRTSFNQSHLMAKPAMPSQTGGGNLNTLGQVCGLIGLQVNVDERVPQLEVSVLNAVNIERDPNLDYYVRVRILPESKQFKACTTQPSYDMNWKETFLFQNFPIQQTHRMALEIGIWVHDEAPRLSAYAAQPLCEALIPLHGARERNTDFWPLRPPPSSPQSRRKSLNDLMENGGHLSGIQQGSEFRMGQQLQATADNSKAPSNYKPNNNTEPNDGVRGSSLRIQDQENTKYPSELSARERSCSNKNLPDLGRLGRAQSRRASDELAGSSSNRYLSSHSNPAASRRSISIINVADKSIAGSVLAAGIRSGQRQPAGSQQPNSRADLGQQQHNHHRTPSNDGPIGANKLNFPAGNTPTTNQTRAGESFQPIGVTPTGRRFSLIGIQSMSGYRSQRSSQSGSNEQESPRQLTANTQKRPQSSGQQQLQSQALVQTAANEARKQQQHLPTWQRHRGSVAGISQASSGGTGSRRGSIEQGYQYQRKGSFAMQTLRKLKRTMSLTKGTDQDPSGSNQDSRRSSSTSADSSYDVHEDAGLSRKLLAQGRVGHHGKLKLSFILTKGQLEIDVICAQGLKLDSESSLGVYVKMYLKGKSRTNKRKTRIVSPTEHPVFKQIIKYDGSLVDNKVLDISVWQKQSGLKGKMPIGFTEVQLADLNLEYLQTSWYNLRPMEMARNSSIDE